jgi:Ca2+-binding RTX toxin-like protein
VDPDCFNDHPFVVPGGPGIDNDSATVSLEWTNGANDWDLIVFRDGDGDGQSITPGQDVEVAQSGNPPPGVNESATFNQPETADGRLEPGNYVARVVNYATVTPDPYTLSVGFAGPEPFVPGQTESWKLTCTYAGEARVTQEIVIARGERQTLDLSQCGTGGRDIDCQGAKATLVGSKNGDAIIGTKRRDVIAALGGNDRIRGRGGKDVVCAKGGGDNVSGGRGRDRVSAGGGKDRVNGGRHGDTVKGGGGVDRLRGAKGGDKLNGGGDDDRLYGGKGGDRLRGGGGDDRCLGGPGRDRRKGC